MERELRERRQSGETIAEITARPGRLAARSRSAIAQKAWALRLSGPRKPFAVVGRALAVPLPASMWHWLDCRARELHVSRPEVVRRAIAAAMRRAGAPLEEWT